MILIYGDFGMVVESLNVLVILVTVNYCDLTRPFFVNLRPKTSEALRTLPW